MMLPKVKVPRVHKPVRTPVSTGPRPTFDNGNEAEVLSGVVKNMQASAIEERFARALDKSRIPYEFRYTLFAPRNLPGFKELDFLLEKNGQMYAVEIDSLFTHRRKHEADRLHDALVLNELDQQGYDVYPQVYHVLGDTELADQTQANSTVKRMFG